MPNVASKEPHSHKSNQFIECAFVREAPDFCLVDGGDTDRFITDYHNYQSLSLDQGYMVNLSTSKTPAEGASLSFKPIVLDSSTFTGFSLPDVPPEFLKRWCYNIDQLNGDPIKEDGGPPIPVEHEAFAPEVQLTRALGHLITNEDRQLSQHTRSLVKAFLYQEVFEWPADGNGIPEKNSPEAIALWKKVSNHFVCVMDKFPGSDINISAMDRKPKFSVMTSFEYPSFNIYPPHCTNFHGPQDGRELVHVPKYVCDFIHELAQKVFTEDRIPWVVKVMGLADFDNHECKWIHKNRKAFYKFTSGKKIPTVTSSHQSQENFVTKLMEVLPFAQPCIAMPRDGTEMESAAVKPLAPRTMSERIKYDMAFNRLGLMDGQGELTFAKLKAALMKEVAKAFGVKFSNHFMVRKSQKVVLRGDGPPVRKKAATGRGGGGRGGGGGGGRGGGGGDGDDIEMYTGFLGPKKRTTIAEVAKNVAELTSAIQQGATPQSLQQIATSAAKAVVSPDEFKQLKTTVDGLDTKMNTIIELLQDKAGGADGAGGKRKRPDDDSDSDSSSQKQDDDSEYEEEEEEESDEEESDDENSASDSDDSKKDSGDDAEDLDGEGEEPTKKPTDEEAKKTADEEAKKTAGEEAKKTADEEVVVELRSSDVAASIEAAGDSAPVSEDASVLAGVPADAQDMEEDGDAAVAIN